MQSEKELRERINKLAELAAGVRQKNLSRRVSKTLLGVIAVIALLLPFIGLLIEGRSNINPDNIYTRILLSFYTEILGALLVLFLFDLLFRRRNIEVAVRQRSITRYALVILLIGVFCLVFVVVSIYVLIDAVYIEAV